MPYQKKTWQDRISDNPLRRTLTPIDGSAPITVDVTRAEGNVTEAGDPFNAQTMNDLENRIEAGIGGGDANMAPVETNEQGVSENAYTIGQHLIFGGQYYKVTQAIAVGDSIVEGVNVTPETVGGEVTGLKDQLHVDNTDFYFDYHDGKFGFNTSPTRGADTFVPFSNQEEIASKVRVNLTVAGENGGNRVKETNYTFSYGQTGNFNNPVGHGYFLSINSWWLRE